MSDFVDNLYCQKKNDNCKEFQGGHHKLVKWNFSILL